MSPSGDEISNADVNKDLKQNIPVFRDDEEISYRRRVVPDDALVGRVANSSQIALSSSNDTNQSNHTEKLSYSTPAPAQSHIVSHPALLVTCPLGVSQHHVVKPHHLVLSNEPPVSICKLEMQQQPHQIHPLAIAFMSEPEVGKPEVGELEVGKPEVDESICYSKVTAITLTHEYMWTILYKCALKVGEPAIAHRIFYDNSYAVLLAEVVCHSLLTLRQSYNAYFRKHQNATLRLFPRFAAHTENGKRVLLIRESKYHINLSNGNGSWCRTTQ
ncbi:hypothetical protein WOLCODRAFT_15352 [Wolfiporia cocos MD-104 SS10]|uniref:Uncharacterized protein n=1 Tax=Wolfiporia cocos (strain MD-104) TaxID=742152 RepID=A0A2H3IWW6_WOLCO|nr:hypothetical protein WOLCODRAFT_15352 [Wolfiporia cocos MD-104 SS10]